MMTRSIACSLLALLAAVAGCASPGGPWPGGGQNSGRRGLMSTGHPSSTGGEGGAAADLQERGVAAAKEGRFNEANAYFQAAEQVGPPSAELLNDAGYCYFIQGRLEEAEAKYRQALALDPWRKATHNNLGIVLARQGKDEDSLLAFRNVVGEEQAQANLALAKSNNAPAPGDSPRRIETNPGPALAAAPRSSTRSESGPDERPSPTSVAATFSPPPVTQRQIPAAPPTKAVRSVPREEAGAVATATRRPSTLAHLTPTALRLAVAGKGPWTPISTKVAFAQQQTAEKPATPSPVDTDEELNDEPERDAGKRPAEIAKDDAPVTPPNSESAQSRRPETAVAAATPRQDAAAEQAAAPTSFILGGRLAQNQGFRLHAGTAGATPTTSNSALPAAHDAERQDAGPPKPLLLASPPSASPPAISSSTASQTSRPRPLPSDAVHESPDELAFAAFRKSQAPAAFREPKTGRRGPQETFQYPETQYADAPRAAARVQYLETDEPAIRPSLFGSRSPLFGQIPLWERFRQTPAKPDPAQIEAAAQLLISPPTRPPEVVARERERAEKEAEAVDEAIQVLTGGPGRAQQGEAADPGNVDEAIQLLTGAPAANPFYQQQGSPSNSSQSAPVESRPAESAAGLQQRPPLSPRSSRWLAAPLIQADAAASARGPSPAFPTAAAPPPYVAAPPHDAPGLPPQPVKVFLSDDGTATQADAPARSAAPVFVGRPQSAAGPAKSTPANLSETTSSRRR